MTNNLTDACMRRHLANGIAKLTPSPWLYYAVAGYFMTFGFEGALRFALQSAGLGSLLYLRDLIPLMLLMYMSLRWVQGIAVPVSFIFAGVAVLFHFFVGRYALPSLFQSLFGLKILLPLLSGVLVAHIYGDQIFRGRWVAWVLLLVLIGVAVNYFVKMPWEGEMLETAFGSFTQSRNWTADGVRRLAGFTRASFDAASVLMVLGVVQLSRMRFGLAWAIVFLTVFIGIAATTTKGALLGFAAFALLYMLTLGGAKKRVGTVLIGGAGLLVAVVPLMANYVTLRAATLSSEAFWLFSSFLERLNGMWPAAFHLLDSPWLVLLGRGIGGIGVSQAYGDWWNLNAADNLFVYLIVSFGMFGVLYYLALLARLAFRRFEDAPRVLLFNGLAISIVTYGLTSNIVESAILSATVGYLLVCEPTAKEKGQT